MYVHCCPRAHVYFFAFFSLFCFFTLFSLVRMQDEAMTENCVCGECFQQNANIQTILEAVNATHPTDDMLANIKDNIKTMTDACEKLEELNAANGSLSLDEHVKHYEDQLNQIKAQQDNIMQRPTLLQQRNRTLLSAARQRMWTEKVP